MNMLNIKTVHKVKYAQCISPARPMHHFPNHCHERTSGMSDSNSTLTQEHVKQLFNYDPDSGEFTRKVNHKNGLKAGEVAGCKIGVREIYLSIRINRKLYLCHRLDWLYVYGNFPFGVIDHINGDGLDNRIANLRDITNEQNIQATLRIPVHNTSGFKGVYLDKKRHKWVAGISIKNKRIVIGSYATAEAASLAYLAAKKEVHFS